MNIVNNWIWSFDIYQKFIKVDLAVQHMEYYDGLSTLQHSLQQSIYTDSALLQQVAERASSAGDTNQILMTISCLKEKNYECKMDNSRHPCGKILAWLVCTSIFAIIWYLLFSFLSRLKRTKLKGAKYFLSWEKKIKDWKKSHVYIFTRNNHFLKREMFYFVPNSSLRTFKDLILELKLMNLIFLKYNL